MGNSEFILPVTTNVSTDDVTTAIEAERLNRQGNSVPAELCPVKIWADDPERPLKRVLDLFCARGMFIVSNRAANVLRSFDLGGGALHPVADGVWANDLETRFPGEFFTWIFGNKKTSFAPDHSPNKRAFGVAGTSWNMPFVMKDNDIAVTPAALDGPDVWLDRFLVRSVFMSGALGQALEDAGLRKSFGLKKCRII